MKQGLRLVVLFIFLITFLVSCGQKKDSNEDSNAVTTLAGSAGYYVLLTAQVQLDLTAHLVLLRMALISTLPIRAIIQLEKSILTHKQSHFLQEV